MNASTTSQAAYDSLNPTKATALREKVFELIKNSDGLTDEEIQQQLRIPGNTERPRRWELSHKQGRIRQSGTRETKTGRQAVVWVANTNPQAPEPPNVRPRKIDVKVIRQGEVAYQCKTFARGKNGRLYAKSPQLMMLLPLDEIEITL